MIEQSRWTNRELEKLDEMNVLGCESLACEFAGERAEDESDNFN